MKSILFAVLLIFSASALAADKPSEKYMSVEEQNQYIENKAKEIRRFYWQNGYKNVDSYEEFVTKAMLDEHVKGSNSDQYENFFDKEEVSQLYRCYYSDSCELYLVLASSSYRSGYGEEAHFVMLYTKSKKNFTLKHTVYAE